MKIFEKIYDDIDKDCGDFTKKTTKNSDIKNMYDFVGDLNEGLVQVILKGKYGFIDKTGKEIIPCKYNNANNFKEGLAAVNLNGKWGYIDKTGREICPCKYDWAYDFFKGLAKVKLNNKYGYIDTTGKEVIPCIFDGITYNNQMFYVKFHGKYGCINQLGDMFVPCIFDISPFLEDGKIKMVNDGISTIYSLEGEIIY